MSVYFLGKILQMKKLNFKDQHMYITSMLASKVMPYLLRLAAPLMPSSIVP